MKALGIVRKIDDLGRVVIPKEIRRQNGWKEGAPMELFATEDGLFIREYGGDRERTALAAKIRSIQNFTDNTEEIEILQKAIDVIKRGE